MNHTLNEKQKRQHTATLAKTHKYDRATMDHEITEHTLNTITRRKKELTPSAEHKSTRIRKTGEVQNR
jgi:hypothetical protein